MGIVTYFLLLSLFINISKKASSFIGSSKLKALNSATFNLPEVLGKKRNL